jgi:hypothetical protein
LVPTGDEVINDQFSTGQPNSREFFYAASNITGESQSYDGNGPYLRIQPGGGPIKTRAHDAGGNLATDKNLYANTIAPPLGTQPQLGGLPAKNPNAVCANQPVPDLNAGLGGIGDPSPAVVP